MIVVPFIPAHLENFEVHEWQKDIKEYFSREYADLLSMGHAYTGIIDKRVVAMAGVSQLAPTRWQAWALMSSDTKDCMLKITRQIKTFLDEFKGFRVETPVHHDFKQGHRWIKMLGFKNETPGGMKGYGLNGETYDLYARY